jgi:hypothetical protein
MPNTSGAVDVVNIKEMPAADNYGNTHRASLKIVGEDKWYSYGTIKKPEINIKTNGEWSKLQKGMQVEFMYDVNGDFCNIKKQSFSITNTECEDSPQPVVKQSQPAQQPQSAPASKGAFVNPAEVGQCLNLAVEVMKLNAEDLLNDAKVTEAITWYKAVREKFNALYNLPPAKPKEKPVAKPAPVPTDVDNFDDDI